MNKLWRFIKKVFLEVVMEYVLGMYLLFFFIGWLMMIPVMAIVSDVSIWFKFAAIVYYFPLAMYMIYTDSIKPMWEKA